MFASFIVIFLGCVLSGRVTHSTMVFKGDERMEFNIMEKSTTVASRTTQMFLLGFNLAHRRTTSHMGIAGPGQEPFT